MQESNGDHHLPVKGGTALTEADVEMIIDAIELRQHNFPLEPTNLTIALVMMGIGDRFSQVTCVGDEHWQALKQDVPKSPFEPHCPDGHDLIQNNRVRLGWLSEDL